MRIDPGGYCDFFVLNPAQIQYLNGMVASLRGDREGALIAAAEYGSAIRGGLPHDDEMAARFVLGEEYQTLICNSGMDWDQIIASPQFKEAMLQMQHALAMDRDGGYGYFAEPLNRARLRRLDRMCEFSARAIDNRGDRKGAIAFLQQTIGLCSYLPSYPLLNALFLLAAYFALEGERGHAKTCLNDLIAAEPVDRVDEDGTERALREEARKALSSVS